jgi:hypothetical protein
MGAMNKPYIHLLIGKYERKRPDGRPRQGYEVNIHNKYIKAIGCSVVEWIYMAQNCEQCNLATSNSTKGNKFNSRLYL